MEALMGNEFDPTKESDLYPQDEMAEAQGVDAGSEFDPTKESDLYPQDEMAEAQGVDAGREAVDEEQSEEDRLAAMEKRLQETESRYQQMLDRQQQTIDRLLASPAPGSTASPQAEAAAPDLPDPVEDPKGFRDAIRQQIQDQTQKVQTSITSEQAQQQRLKQIQSRFWEENSDLSSFPEFVDAAYNKEAKRLLDAGVDPQQALLKDPEGMSQRVAETARARMRELNIGSKRPSGQRTAGVSGGTATRPAAKTNGANVSSFIDQLKAAQMKSGYF